MTPRPSTLTSRARSSLLLLVLPAAIAAQSPEVRFEVMYTCPELLRFKIHSCAGADPTSPCDVQGYSLTRTGRHGSATRRELMDLLRSCHVQTAAEAQADARAASVIQSGGAGVAESASHGIKVGDQVEALTGFGWSPAKVVAISGNSYRVAVNGVQVTKDYPAEVRRLGAPTAEDRANGQYRLGDYVQVNVQGSWITGKVITAMGGEFQVELPGNRTAWADPRNLRPGTAPDAPAAPKAGTPPRAGVASCAGKIEGRYATTGAGMGSFTMTFRSGKATMTDAGGNQEVFECWTGGGKVLLRQPGHENMDMDIDINDDGTLQTPIGELKKKGS